MLVHISWLFMSMKRLPSGVQKWTPLAPATGIGSTLDWADHSNSVWRLVRATISSPVIFFSSVAVLIRTSLLQVAQRRHPAGGCGLADGAQDRVGHRLGAERADLAQAAVVDVARERAGREREDGVAVARGVDRRDRPREAVVGHLRQL